MVNRILEYPIEVPICEDDLRTNRNFMIGLGKLTEAVFGNETLIQGLLCKPTTPASLDVLVEAGQIFSWQNVDDSAYSELPADTDHQIVKQGLILDETTLACPPPVTAGFSINYLVQIEFQEVDALNEERAFYNSADPSQPYYVYEDSQREDKCLVTVKAGTAATTGTQVTPAPDVGNVGAWVVTVTEGQTTITANDITEYPEAPFIKATKGLYYAQVTNDGSNNYEGVSKPPVPAYEDGIMAIIKPNVANTGDSTLDLGHGAIQLLDLDGAALHANELKAEFPYIVIYNNNKWIIQVTSQANINKLPKDYRSGTLLVNNSIDILKDLDFQAGAWRSQDDTTDLILASTFVKQIDANWAPGTDAGGFPSGLTLTADTQYHAFLIGKPDGTTDSGVDSDIDAVNLLADATGYTKIKRVGTIWTDVSLNIVEFIMFYEGNTRVVYWHTPIIDYTLPNPGTSAVLVPLRTPLDVNVMAIINHRLDSPSLATEIYYSNPLQADLLSTVVIGNAWAAANVDNLTQITIMTDTTKQIRYRLVASNASTVVSISTIGWKE